MRPFSRPLRIACAVVSTAALLAPVGGCGQVRTPSDGESGAAPPHAAAERFVSPAPKGSTSAPEADRSGDLGPRTPHERALPAPANAEPPEAPPAVATVIRTRPAGAVAAGVPDGAELAAHGIRTLVSTHVTLYTDLPASPEGDELPEVFDQAVAPWCKYFGIDRRRAADWHPTACVMLDAERFRTAGLLPETLPAFENGFATADQVWLYEQPTAYYRRHLLLHEGTHAFMLSMLGGAGTTWYMEGVAELLATHRWADGALELRHFPANRDEVPMLGRIKLVQQAVRRGEIPSLEALLALGFARRHENETYAWCWALCALLDGHPRYRDRFAELVALAARPDFNDQFRRVFADRLDILAEEWQVFAAELEHGHDLRAWAIDFTPGKSVPEAGASVEVDTQRGWQNTGLQLVPGTEYRLRAYGRYQVAQQPQVWWCEPGGVSIRYYRGRPLGMLLAVVRPGVTAPDAPNAFLEAIPIGLESRLHVERSGTLYLRINDSAGELHDNRGTLRVEVTPRAKESGAE